CSFSVTWRNTAIARSRRCWGRRKPWWPSLSFVFAGNYKKASNPDDGSKIASRQMNNDNKKQNPLDQAIAAMRRDEAPGNVVEAAASRVWINISGAEMATSAVRISGCEDVRLLLGAFRARTLPAERALLVEDHLHECVECRLAYHQDNV